MSSRAHDWRTRNTIPKRQTGSTTGRDVRDTPTSNPGYRRGGAIVRLPIQATSGSGTVTVPEPLVAWMGKKTIGG